MSSTTSMLKKRLYLTGAFVLVLGLASAALIYTYAGDNDENATGYELVNGVAYPVSPKESKAFQRDVRLYGGKFALLSDELFDWFASLWQGRTLAFTVAGIAVVLAAGMFLVANGLLTDPDSNLSGESNRDSSG